MDSDIYLHRRFDEILPEDGFATFNSKEKDETHRYDISVSAGENGIVGQTILFTRSHYTERYGDYN